MAADDRLTRVLKILAVVALGMALAVSILAFLHRIIAVVVIVVLIILGNQVKNVFCNISGGLGQ